MAFSESNPPRMIAPMGLTGLSPVAPGALWFYRSSDANAAVTATGYFTRCGYGSRSGPQVGMRVGDVVICAESSAGASPGKISMHAVTASTADQASTSASTGYTAGYNVSLSTGT